MSSIIDHIVICGYEPKTRLLLDAIGEDVDPEKQNVIIFAPGERPADIPAAFMWVSGDPSKESEMEKVRMAHAAAVVIVGSRALSPQHADAMTILVAFTIRSFVSARPEVNKRKHSLYIVGEILDAENVAHAKAAGVDEVIETTQLGFSLLAHAINEHGTAELMSQVARVGAHSLYVGIAERKGTKSFAELRRSVKSDTGALVIGVHDPVSGEDLVNPPEDFMIGKDSRVIYLAKKPILPTE